MRLYRVVVSFFRENLQYLAERGVLAMTPGQALDDTLSHLGIDQTRIVNFKSQVSKPEKLEEFNNDTQMLDCLNSTYMVKDVWQARYA